MTSLKWVEEHIDFALKAESTEEVINGLRAVITRLDISPLEEGDQN